MLLSTSLPMQRVCIYVSMVCLNILYTQPSISFTEAYKTKEKAVTGFLLMGFY